MLPSEDEEPMRFVSWGQGPGYFIVPRDLAELIVELANEYDAMVIIIGNGRPGGIQPQLMPRELWEGAAA